MFPPKYGVYKTYSPRETLTGKPVDYTKYFKISFGSYGQAIHETKPTNTITPRKLGIIYLQALDMIQGGFEVMNLLTGNIISRHKVTTIQITQEVIDRVEDLAKRDGI